MTQQVRALAAKPDDASFLPGTHKLKGEKLSSDCRIYSMAID